MKVQDLTLVGLSEDKQRLVLVSDAGEEFTLPADARLRAALRGEHARLGQLEITMDSALRPRDIQARIRAGESPEDVAAAAQTTRRQDHGVRRAGAGRARPRRRPRAARLRAPQGRRAARPGTLGDAVAEQLRAPQRRPRRRVEWDAWRREDGRWTLVADYRSGERSRHAEFIFDAPGSYVVAENDEARWLVGEQPSARARSRAPAPATAPAAHAGRRARRRAAAGRRRHRAGADDRRAPSAPTPEAPDRGPRPRPRPRARRPATPTGSPPRPRAPGAARSRREPADDARSPTPSRSAEPEPGARGRTSRRHAAPSARRRAGRRCRAGTRSCSAAASASDRPDAGAVTALPDAGYLSG